MCGLLGVIAAEGKCVDASDVKQLLHIGELAQRRGVDASGLILIGDDVGLQVVKANQ